MNVIIFWAALLVFFVIIEIAAVNLISIWLALGSVGALITAAIAPGTENLWIQILIFLTVSAVALYFTRPLAKKYLKGREVATNSDRVLDMVGVVRESIHNLDGQGVVYVGGKLWSARGEVASPPIEEGTQVDIIRIEGVKLIVRPHMTTESITT